MSENLFTDIERLIEGMTDAGNKAAGGVWRAPLVSAVPADHPDFALLPRLAVPDHLAPSDILPGARSVIVFFIPYTQELSKANAAGRSASASWARAYVDTNVLIDRITRAVADLAAGCGYKAAVAPATGNFDPGRLVSRWSHRHVAWIAGMGSFGINNMLITEKGSCGRFGSLVTAIPAPAGGEGFGTGTLSGRTERCRFKIDGTCGACVRRCVNGALSPDAFDRRRCYGMCLENAKRFADAGTVGGGPEICGKCAVGIPCAFIE
jgi:epoxyqueuosine reductase QueG